MCHILVTVQCVGGEKHAQHCYYMILPVCNAMCVDTALQQCQKVVSNAYYTGSALSRERTVDYHNLACTSFGPGSRVCHLNTRLLYDNAMQRYRYGAWCVSPPETTPRTQERRVSKK